jgi:hypothetical protein
VIARLLFAWTVLLIAGHLVVAWTNSPEARCASVGAEVVTLVQLDQSEERECRTVPPQSQVVKYSELP